MKATCKTLLLYVLITNVIIHADPITFVVGLVSAFVAIGGGGLYWLNQHESCHPKWVDFNRTGLKLDLERKVYGQHMASGIILKAVSGFMNDNNPKKPLVLSLHGSSGTGKNFVSQLIAENIYKKGMNSSFVHLFTKLNFPHPSQIETYKFQLQQLIKNAVTNCARSMFIFDEMDKMDPRLIDSIKPYLEYYEKVDGVSTRRAIFIFLSNAGGESIVQTALEFWRAGRDREEIELQDLEEVLSQSVFNNKQSGLWHTSLIENNMVDFFVPFLPLEQRHVAQCAMVAMAAMGMQPNIDKAYQVAGSLIYYPKSERVFSAPGCKTVVSRLHYYF